jgi:hypothetical protein
MVKGKQVVEKTSMNCVLQKKTPDRQELKLPAYGFD